MASNQDLLNKIDVVKADIEEFKNLVLVYISEVNSLTARFLAKLAVGNDTQSAIDQLNTIALSELTQKLQSAIDQAKIEAN